MTEGLTNRVVQVIEDLDLILAADIARRCKVSRTSVMRWRLADLESAVPVLPPPHRSRSEGGSTGRGHSCDARTPSGSRHHQTGRAS